MRRLRLQLGQDTAVAVSADPSWLRDASYMIVFGALGWIGGHLAEYGWKRWKRRKRQG